MVARRGRGRRRARLFVGPGISRDQKNLDLILRARRRRLQRDAAGRFLLDRGREAKNRVVPAVRLDRHEPADDLSREQFHGRPRL